MQFFFTSLALIALITAVVRTAPTGPDAVAAPIFPPGITSAAYAFFTPAAAEPIHAGPYAVIVPEPQPGDERTDWHVRETPVAAAKPTRAGPYGPVAPVFTPSDKQPAQPVYRKPTAAAAAAESTHAGPYALVAPLPSPGDGRRVYDVFEAPVAAERTWPGYHNPAASAQDDDIRFVTVWVTATK